MGRDSWPLTLVPQPLAPNTNPVGVCLRLSPHPSSTQVHFPAKYVPLGVAYTKRKLVEHGIVEKANGAVLAISTHAKTALQKGLETDMGKKGLELKIKMGGMASQLAGSSAVSGGVAMADSIRLKVGDKLRAQSGPAPTEASVVPASPAGEEKVRAGRPRPRTHSRLARCLHILHLRSILRPGTGVRSAANQLELPATGHKGRRACECHADGWMGWVLWRASTRVMLFEPAVHSGNMTSAQVRRQR